MKMNIHRAKELLVPLKKGNANGISPEWAARLIEALEYVIENESNVVRVCPACEAMLEEHSVYCDNCGADTPRR